VHFIEASLTAADVARDGVHMKRGGKLKTAKAIKDFVWGL
jgi:hypothetical protein